MLRERSEPTWGGWNKHRFCSLEQSLTTIIYTDTAFGGLTATKSLANVANLANFRAMADRFNQQRLQMQGIGYFLKMSERRTRLDKLGLYRPLEDIRFIIFQSIRRSGLGLWGC